MGLDLSNPAEFAALTGAGASVVANLFGANPNLWQLEEAAYNGVKFHILDSSSKYGAGLASVQDTGGRELDIIKYAYKDGTTTDDLGRKGGTYTCIGSIFGPNYLIGLQSLLIEFNKTTPGVFTHPIRGDLTVKILDTKLMHEHTTLQAVGFTFVFVEHDFDLGNISNLAPDNIGSLLSDALDILSGITGVINTVNNSIALANATKAFIVDYLEAAEQSTSIFLTSSNATFNNNSASYPTLLPVNEGGNRTSTGGPSSTVYIAGSNTPVPIPLSLVPPSFTGESNNNDLTPNKVQTDLLQARSDLKICIQSFIDNGVELEFNSEILFLTTSAVELQKIYDEGIKSSRISVFDYELPYDTSLFTAGFLNGITPSRIVELANLNNDLESILWIPKGTIIKMPTT